MIITANGKWFAKRPRRIRFGLGSILLLTGICCGVLGVWAFVVQPYRAAALLRARILDLNGTYVTHPANGPAWQAGIVEMVLGERKFVDVVEIEVHDERLSESDFRLIGQMRHLKRLDLDRTALSDVAAERFSTLRHLERFSARYTQISDQGARALFAAPGLHQVLLTGCEIHDAALAAIPDDAEKEIFLRWTNVSVDAARNVMSRALQCRIYTTAQLGPAAQLSG